MDNRDLFFHMQPLYKSKHVSKLVIYIALKPQKREENQGAYGMGARGQDMLTESSGSSNDILMKRVFETAGM